MTRKELVEKLSIMPEFADIPYEELERLVKLFFGCLTSALASGRRIEIRNFGSFTTRLRKAHIARNPKNNERAEVPEHHMVHFNAGQGLKKRVNKQTRDPET